MRMRKDTFSINLTTEYGRLDFATQLWKRFCIEMIDDPGKARTRLISNIQVALLDAIDGGYTEPPSLYEPNPNE